MLLDATPDLLGLEMVSRVHIVQCRYAAVEGRG